MSGEVRNETGLIVKIKASVHKDSCWVSFIDQRRGLLVVLHSQFSVFKVCTGGYSYLPFFYALLNELNHC